MISCSAPLLRGTVPPESLPRSNRLQVVAAPVLLGVPSMAMVTGPNPSRLGISVVVIGREATRWLIGSTLLKPSTGHVNNVHIPASQNM